MRGTRGVLVSAAAIAVVCASCSSTHGGASGGQQAQGDAGRTIKVGILSDITGPGSSAGETTPKGVAAGATVAAKQGWTIKYVVADTQTSLSQALAAAQELVDVDHVDAVIASSGITFAAAKFLTQRGIPVVGVAEDGPEWITSTNMFSVYGFLDSTKVSTTVGDFMKMEGATNIATVGYAISPQSTNGAKSGARSAEHAGLKVGYISTSIPLGSVNVAPIALAMKNAGVDGLEAPLEPNAALQLVTGVRQVGGHLKVALLSTGYGGDLTPNPATLQASQGVYFSSSYEPAEMNTAATRQLLAALRAVGVEGDPTYAEYAGYASVALLLDALKATGPHPTHAALIAALSAVKGFTAFGLFGSHGWNLDNRTGTAGGVDGCMYVTRYEGQKFQLVPGADPICGSEIPGLSVSGS